MATSGGEYALIPTLIPLNNDDNMMMMHCVDDHHHHHDDDDTGEVHLTLSGVTASSSRNGDGFNYKMQIQPKPRLLISPNPRQ